jgi:hypothetical protein
MAAPSSDSETTPVAETDGKRAKQARQRRSARMERFAQTQRCKRNWINVEEIGEVCSELDGSGVPNEAARENAYRNFERDQQSGDFEENGRSRVLYLHPWTVRTRMTREWLRDVIEYNYDGHRGRSQFVPRCWLPRGMYERFAAKHNLPISPPRFRPKHLATAAPEPTDDAAVHGVVLTEEPASSSASGATPPPGELCPEEKSAGGTDHVVAIATEPTCERPTDSPGHLPELSSIGQPSPERAQESLPLGRRVTEKLAREFAESYAAGTTAKGRQPTQKGLEEAARTANLRGGRDFLRNAIVEILGPDAIKRGRPRKINSPK